MDASPSPRRRFYLDGIANPVHARVAHHDDSGMTLRQELPFLRLHSQMRDESGRCGSLTGVSVTLRDGTPCLVLDVSYEPREPEETTPFATEQVEIAPPSVTSLMDATRSKRASRRDETLPYGIRLEAPMPAPSVTPTLALRPIPFWMRWMNWLSQFFAP